jgi:hypothetical protein
MHDTLLRSGDTARNASGCEDIIWLLGQPPLQDYLHFVRKAVVGGADPRSLCDEWRDANDYYYELEQNEAGIADRVERRELDPPLIPLAEAVMVAPSFRESFDRLPTRIGMVELDRLVVFQPHVSCPFVDALKSRLGPAPTAEDVFRLCLPLGGRPDGDMQIRRAGSRRYFFSSESTDIRFHDAVILGADRIRDYTSFGPIGGVLGLVVGFSSNFMSVISSDNRLLLNNGYHRACALRELGVTHAPCVIQTVTRRDELALTAGDRVNDAPAFYFKAARPPLLKDFFDPKIRKVLPVRRTKRVIEVSFEIREFELAE